VFNIKSHDFVDCLSLFVFLSTESCDTMSIHYKYKAYSHHFPPLFNMRPLTSAQQNEILAMLDAGHTASYIDSATDYSLSSVSRLRSKHRPHLLKSLGGRPKKLTSSNIRHATRLIGSGKVDTAVDVT